ncbi:MAG: glycosyltransferase family 4 protein [Dehalococcoidia bacterium]|uniref:glycosyltransferase family 4 protein n=1 Tax=Candidatus Amarobacter glycogenicus TaxID=3140699 RepID=UPI002A0C4BEF|nr:glycosyltransferase family 4 protein [Dehalococcoidia bacterium]MBK9612591.1 glycosyltransferase family 4 protein [Dehalococcoidia bacterium]
MTRLLVLSRSAVGPRMASPGVRAYQLAGALGRALPAAEITLGIPGDREPIAPPAPNVRMQAWSSNAEAAFLAAAHDVTIARNFPPQLARVLGKTRFALDAFTPFYVEWMELSRRDILPKWRRTWMASNRSYINFQLTLADFIFCADERQRDMWIGMMMALALVPPDVYERDPSLRRVIDVVPYGVPSRPLSPGRRVLRGVVPGIEEGDRVLLWNGGITEWNDVETLLHAMARLVRTRPEVKLVFMGVSHPDMVFGPTSGVNKLAYELSEELGLKDRNVFILNGWVPYEEIDNYLAEADASVCLGYENIESRFAFRTRYVDLFRARVPLLCTQGDVLANRVHDAPMGLTVPERDIDAVVDGITRLLDDRDFVATCKANMATMATELSWDTVVQPLVDFCVSGESYAMPAGRRRLQSYARGGMYVAFKRLCLSPPIYDH